MFERMLFREAEVILKNGLQIEGFITGVFDGFVEIEEHGIFECSIVNLEEVVAIRGKIQEDPRGIMLEESLPCPPKEPVRIQNPVRVAATVSKRPNEFTMPLPNSQEGPYVAPSFVRETNRSEK